MSRANSKSIILDAAEAIVTEAGASQMTLDAVAERSGISKGGLMYNFPSKEALLVAMVERLHGRLDNLRDQAREEYIRTHPDEPVNFLFVEIDMLRQMSATELRLGGALLAATFNKPELLSDLRCNMRDRLHEQLIGTRPFDCAAMLFFSALGLHFHRLLNLAMVDEAEEQQIFEGLLRLAAGGLPEKPEGTC